MNQVTVDPATRPQWVKPSEWLKLHPGLFGKDTFYARLRDGSLPSVRVGRKILVRDDLLDVLAEAGRGGA